MRFVIAVTSVWLAAAGPVFAAPVGQPLSIDLGRNGGQAARLPAYDPHEPIAVTVTEPGDRHDDAVALLASGPAGERVDVALVRSGDRLRGTFTLPAEGTWALHVDARHGRLLTQTSDLALRVENTPPSAAPWIGFAAGSGTFSLLSSAYLLLRRLGRRRPQTGLRPAA